MKEFCFCTIVCWLVAVDCCLSCKKLAALLFAAFVRCNLQDRMKEKDEDEEGTDIEEKEE